jgi:hypothetical protein
LTKLNTSPPFPQPKQRKICRDGFTVEAGRLLFVERAQAHEIGAIALQRHVRTDDINDVIGGADLFESALGNEGHRAIDQEDPPSEYAVDQPHCRSTANTEILQVPSGGRSERADAQGRQHESGRVGRRRPWQAIGSASTTARVALIAAAIQARVGIERLHPPPRHEVARSGRSDAASG